MGFQAVKTHSTILTVYHSNKALRCPYGALHFLRKCLDMDIQKMFHFFILSGGEGADSPPFNFMPFGHSFSCPQTHWLKHRIR